MWSFGSSMLQPVSKDSKDYMTAQDGSIHIPPGSHLLSRLYSNHGVQVRMVRKQRSQKIPTVRELIERLAKKHETLLIEEMEKNKSSSSTPTVPFSTADLLYNPEVSRPAPSADDFSTTDLVYFDREKDKLKLRDIDANRRPTSRNNSRRSISLEKVNFEGEKDELRPIKNTFPTAKVQNPGRTNGVRGTLLRSDQLLNHKNNVQGREPDDLVAMGTIWSPNLQQRNSTTTSTTTSSKSFSLTSTSNTSNVNPRKGPSATTTRVGFPNNFSTSRSTAKDTEPKYTDPVSGASPSFQQRLMELSALEAETVRWERTKKIKKKSKQDRDS